jgi:hypothetical protein
MDWGIAAQWDMLAEERVVVGLENRILIAGPFAGRTSGLNWQHYHRHGSISQWAFQGAGVAISQGTFPMPNRSIEDLVQNDAIPGFARSPPRRLAAA